MASESEISAVGAAVIKRENDHQNTIEKGNPIDSKSNSKTTCISKSDDATNCISESQSDAEKLKLLIESSVSCKNPFKGQKLHKCNDCGRRYWNHDEHMLTHQLDRPFKCVICPKTFKTKAYLNAHQRNHRDKLTRRFKCDQCNANFSKSGPLKRHKAIHSTDRPYQCDKCDRTFRVLKYLKFHELSHTNQNKKSIRTPLTKCNVCGRGCHDIVTHMMEHSGERMFQCALCENSFKTKHHLTNHMAIHINARAFKCKLCPRSFNYRNQLKRHSQAHSSQLSFVCDICGNAFKYNNSLRLHMRTHSGEKPFKCDLCDKCFSTNVSLRLHYRIHTGEKPYKCDLCGRGFADGSTMKIHKRTHTGEHPYICHLCGKSTKQASNLKSHYKHFHKIFDMTSKVIRANARIFARYKSELMLSTDLLEILNKGAAEDMNRSSGNSEIFFNNDAEAIQYAMANVEEVPRGRKVSKVKHPVKNSKKLNASTIDSVIVKEEEQISYDTFLDRFSLISTSPIPTETLKAQLTDQPNEIKGELEKGEKPNVKNEEKSTVKSEPPTDIVRFTLNDYSKYLNKTEKTKKPQLSNCDFSYFAAATTAEINDSNQTKEYETNKKKISKNLLKLIIAKKLQSSTKKNVGRPLKSKVNKRVKKEPPKIEEILINEKTDEIIVSGQIKIEKPDNNERCDDFKWFSSANHVVQYSAENFPKKPIKVEKDVSIMPIKTEKPPAKDSIKTEDTAQETIKLEQKLPSKLIENDEMKVSTNDYDNEDEDDYNDVGDDIYFNNEPNKTTVTMDENKKTVFTTKGVKFQKCTICNRRYMNHEEHMRTHTHERPYECEVCKKTFKTKDYLKLHKRVHSDVKNAICDQCGATFRQAYDLQRHMRRHSDERPHCCPTCGKAFKEKSALVTHIRTHSGEKPFKCSMCEKHFSTRMGLKLHLRTHTGEKPFQCEYCESRFCDGSTYRQHVRTHTGERPYKCHICGKGTTQAGNLKSHLRHYHKMIVKHVNMTNSKYL